MRNILISVCLILYYITLQAQDSIKKSKAEFSNFDEDYYDNYIMHYIDSVNSSKPENNKYFAANLAGSSFPVSPEDFTKCWFNDPVSQGKTGTCWSFATTSFFESEIFRITGSKIKLSEMYFVYWEYVERAKYFVKHKGDCALGEGSEANALPRLMRQYGAMPKSIYTGLLQGQTIYNHSQLIEEISTYLLSVKQTCAWNDSIVVAKVKSILNNYMGEPPARFEFQGALYSPLDFLSEYCELSSADYFSFMSDNKTFFDQKAELVEADNWWHSREYYNISASDFMKIISTAIKGGYTISICGDVSEPGIDKEKQVAVVPTFDIPSYNIDDNARQIRLANGTTTDDHCIHLVGYLVIDGVSWYLTKDSGAGAFDGKYKGYKYLREDYVKLKMMNILLYKYAAKDVLDKIIK